VALGGVMLFTAACGGAARPANPPAGGSAPAGGAPSAGAPPSGPAAVAGGQQPTPAAPAGASGAQAGSVAYRPAPLSPVASARVGVLGSSSDAGIFVAAERGYFTEEGLDVELLTFGNTADQIAASFANQLDVATGTMAANIFNAVGRNVPLRIVADKGSTPGPEWDFAPVMIRKELIDSGRVRDYTDLRGLNVGRASARGNISEIIFVQALAKGGLTLDDVNTTPLTFPDMVLAYANGSVDAGVVIEPFAARIEQMGTAVRWQGSADFYGNQQIAVIIYGPSFMNDRPEVGRRWMTAYLRGVRDFNEAFGPKRQGRDGVVDILIKHTAIKDRDVYDQMRPPGLDPDGKVQVQAIRDDLAYYEQVGLVRERVDVATVLDSSYADYAVQQLGPYSR
jgi:NitT/TauT family transport system substrate-binding protein